MNCVQDSSVLKCYTVSIGGEWRFGEKWPLQTQDLAVPLFLFYDTALTFGPGTGHLDISTSFM